MEVGDWLAATGEVGSVELSRRDTPAEFFDSSVNKKANGKEIDFSGVNGRCSGGLDKDI